MLKDIPFRGKVERTQDDAFSGTDNRRKSSYFFSSNQEVHLATIWYFSGLGCFLFQIM